MLSFFSLAQKSGKNKKKGEIGRRMAEEALLEFEEKAIERVKNSNY